MPAKSKAQQGFMGAELARKRAGKPTQTGMSTQQLTDFASTKTAGLPKYKNPGKPKRKRGSFSSPMKEKFAGPHMRGATPTRFKVT